MNTMGLVTELDKQIAREKTIKIRCNEMDRFRTLFSKDDSTIMSFKKPAPVLFSGLETSDIDLLIIPKGNTEIEMYSQGYRVLVINVENGYIHLDYNYDSDDTVDSQYPNGTYSITYVEYPEFTNNRIFMNNLSNFPVFTTKTEKNKNGEYSCSIYAYLTPLSFEKSFIQRTHFMDFHTAIDSANVFISAFNESPIRNIGYCHRFLIAKPGDVHLYQIVNRINSEEDDSDGYISFRELDETDANIEGSDIINYRYSQLLRISSKHLHCIYDEKVTVITKDSITSDTNLIHLIDDYDQIENIIYKVDSLDFEDRDISTYTNILETFKSSYKDIITRRNLIVVDTTTGKVISIDEKLYTCIEDTVDILRREYGDYLLTRAPHFV